MARLSPAALIVGGILLAGVSIGTLARFFLDPSAGTSSPGQMLSATPPGGSPFPAATTAGAPPRAASTATTVPSGAADDPTRQALTALDRFAHPADPDKPANVRGMSDEEIAGLAPDEIAQLIESTIEFAQERSGDPRHLFALGRAALIHGDEELAWDLLVAAGEAGSSAAHAYLAQMADEPEDVQNLLTIASAGGFRPASEWLSEITSPEGTTPPGSGSTPAAGSSGVPTSGQGQTARGGQTGIADELAAFNQSGIIRSFYEGNTSSIQVGLLEAVTYSSALSNTLADNGVLFLVQNPQIKLELDPNMGYYASRKLLATRQGTEKMVGAGVQSFWDILSAMVGTRQKGGSVMDEVTAMNEAALNTPMAKLDIISAQARQDGERLAMLYDRDPETFRRIYAGLKTYLQN